MSYDPYTSASELERLRQSRKPAARPSQPTARPRVILMILGAGLLTLVLLLFLGHAMRSSQQGDETQVALVEAPVDQTPAAEVLPISNAPVKTVTPLPGPVGVDPRAPIASAAPESPLSIPDRWGIEITRVGVAAGGKALDLRYKVLDVAKATSLLYLTNFVYVFNTSNDKVLMVPFQRENQTSQKLVAGKTYFTLLPNKEQRVKSGNLVTVVVGGSRAENLVVN